MKFALAVGDNRHYVIQEIMPRHFVQTAAKNGLPASIVQAIFDELLQAEEAAISKVMSDLPTGFPQELAQSIISGLRARLQLIEGTDTRARQQRS
jgi:serine/threonine-protein kinase HipA